MIPFGKTLIRAVTHLDVTSEHIERAIEICADVLFPLRDTQADFIPLMKNPLQRSSP